MNEVNYQLVFISLVKTTCFEDEKNITSKHKRAALNDFFILL